MFALFWIQATEGGDGAVRTMMLEEVAMENWPKTSEWLRAPS